MTERVWAPVGDEEASPPQAWGRIGEDYLEKKAKTALGVEQSDEIRWGGSFATVLNVIALGTFASPLSQIVQAARPARAWSINVALTLPSGANAIPVVGNDRVIATFLVELGVGSSKITQFVQIDSLTDIFESFLGLPPSVNKVITSVPAKQLIISGIVEWRTLGAPAPGPRSLLLTAQVAPIIR
jgi:hypothetical protein